MRKSQIYSHIFVYILTIILVSFILVYGYRVINEWRYRVEKIACIKLQNDLQSTIKSVTSEYGKIKKEDIELCFEYDEICFVESFEAIDIDNLQTDDTIDPIIKDSILSSTGKNVFLVKSIAKESFYGGNISVNPDVLCIKTLNKRVSLRIEGFGNHVVLSKWA